jgi:hypothetical protein
MPKPTTCHGSHRRTRLVGLATMLPILPGFAGCGLDGFRLTAPDTASYVLSIVVPFGDTEPVGGNPTVVVGAAHRAWVSLFGNAPAGGANVTLTSSDRTVAAVPASVFVPEGQPEAAFTISGVSHGAAVITAHWGRTVTQNVAVIPTPPTVVDFRILPNSGTLAPVTSEQCEVYAVELDSGTSVNSMKCTFDGSLSHPQGLITSYIWTIPLTPALGTAVFTTTTPFFGGERVGCGSFGAGEVGTTVDKEIGLEVVIASGNKKVVRTITFIRNSPC